MICTAHRSNGDPCKAHAVKGKKVCRCHGGAAGSGRPPVTGRYSKVAKGKLAERLAEQDDAPLDCMAELRLQQAGLAEYVSSLSETKLRPIDIARICEWSQSIVRTAQRIVRMRNDTALTVAEVQFLQAGMASLINEFVPDPDQRRAFVTRLRSLVPRRDGADDGGSD
jgi:hypothetical protein